MKIRTQFIFMLALFAAVSLLIVGSLLVVGRQAEGLGAQQQLAWSVEREAGELGYLADDYLLYRESQQRLRWQAKFSEFSSDLANLVPSTPEEAALVGDLRANAQRFSAVFGQVAASLESRPGTPNETTDLALIQVPWSRMAVQSQGLAFDASQLSQLYRVQTDGLNRTNLILIIALVGIFCVYALANSFQVLRRILGSIAILHAGTQAIGAGNLDVAIPAEGADEIGELSIAFNQMARNLKTVTASKAQLEQEIGDRKRAEDSLRRRTEELQAIMEAVPAAIFITREPDARTITGNRVARELVESGSGDNLSKSAPQEERPTGWQEMRNGLPIPTDELLLQQAAHGKEVRNFEMDLVFRDGSVKSVMGNATPLRNADGGPQGGIAILMDVTEHRRAEEHIRTLNQSLEQQAARLQETNLRLEESLAKEQVARAEAQAGRNILESFMQHTPEVILIADAPDVDIRRISAYGQQLIGRPLDQVLGIPGPNHPFRQQLFQADGFTPIPFEEIPLVRAIRHGQVMLNSEMVLRSADGSRLTMLASSAPIHDADGRITGGVVAWRDITARKQTERSLEEALRHVEKLNHDLKQRAVELEIANQELESFSYSISHDLRAPLASIDNFATLALEDYGPQVPAEAVTYLQLIRNNCTDMTQLVEGLLKFSRFARQPLRKQTVDLPELVRQSLEELSAQQQGRRIEITVESLPPCHADPVLLKQVLVNLLSNALKFTRRREVARIDIGAQCVEGETLYFVRDNGVGFDNEQAEKLFGVFQRLHGEEEYEGTGVGLAIVERIIRRHGGRVCAEAEVDQGATLYFSVEGK